MDKTKTIGRRDFVKGAAASAVAAVGTSVLGGYSSEAKAAPAETSTKEPSFTVMNPCADPDDLNVPGLTPRLASLNGKTIYLVCQKSSKYDMMPYAREIKKRVPSCNIVFCYNAKTSHDLIVREKKPADDPNWTWASIEDMDKTHQKADAAIVCVGF